MARCEQHTPSQPRAGWDNPYTPAKQPSLGPFLFSLSPSPFPHSLGRILLGSCIPSLAAERAVAHRGGGGGRNELCALARSEVFVSIFAI